MTCNESTGEQVYEHIAFQDSSGDRSEQWLLLRLPKVRVDSDVLRLLRELSPRKKMRAEIPESLGFPLCQQEYKRDRKASCAVLCMFRKAR